MVHSILKLRVPVPVMMVIRTKSMLTLPQWTMLPSSILSKLMMEGYKSYVSLRKVKRRSLRRMLKMGADGPPIDGFVSEDVGPNGVKTTTG